VGWGHGPLPRKTSVIDNVRIVPHVMLHHMIVLVFNLVPLFITLIQFGPLSYQSYQREAI